ncbi:hypothetical protein AF335_12090 [Streptomyces eurocidicus]|uniref:Uncharacterized protein n=1 Tax=Streptomyces eurocidicus TaxID=66423 RepID=A0A2N8NXT1_STREU|nr:hypothetical protein AF335_12090 [Streptomyces eurocidicus]
MLALTGIAGGAACALGALTLNLIAAEGECEVFWRNGDVQFKTSTPGTSRNSFTVKATSGSVEISGDPAALATDPVALAKAITYRGAGTGGFELSTADGRTVAVSEPDGTLPTGGVSFVVKSPENPAGTRIPVFSYPAPATLQPELHLLPVVSVQVHVITPVDFTPEFAAVLNDAFGPVAKGGDKFAFCTGDFNA